MDYFKLISLLMVSAVICAAEPPANTYLPASSLSSGLSSQYGAPSSGFGAPSSRYGAPSSRGFGISSQYGAPSLGRNQLGSFRSGLGLSNQYGVPGASGRYASGSLPSSAYGAPSGAGIGGGYNAGGAGGYNAGGARGYNAGGYGQGDDQSEPANYQFNYDVSAPEYGVEFGHGESRQGDDARGSYYVLLPDGRRQRVDYTADLDGYKPVVSYEDTGAAGRFGNNYGGGYQNGGAGRYQNGGAGGYQNGGAAGGYQNGGAAGGYQNGGAAGGYASGSASGPY
ncbi:hypothetical protein O3M35_005638 [Rhynocoris fuscipes]|uniref:Pro-resilin n=1 Tax=Rhynocoris fuscipes TaxID=488301 RepID=A0AAW1DJL9_9HEMI